MAGITVDENSMTKIGENILATEVADNLVLVIKLHKTIGLSSTGKMMGIASTGGFTTLPGNVKGNLYIGKKP